jgi:hypothetical protein
VDTSITETNETTCIQMLVAWKVEGSKPFAHVILIEHAREFTWNEDKLKKLYDKNLNQSMECDIIRSDTWLVNDNMILKISFQVRGMRGNFGLNISISEEEKDDYAMRPLYVDLERWVVS